MALSVKIGSFAFRTTNGSQSITGVGFQPKAVIFVPSRALADGDYAHGYFGMFASLGNAVAENGQWWATADGLSQGRSTYYSGFARAVRLGNAPSYSVGPMADVTSFDADGFTLSVVAASSAYVVNYIAIGGDDLTNVALTQVNTPSTTGTQAITGLGFQPDCTLFFGQQANLDDFGVAGTIGMAAGADQAAQGFSSGHNSSPSNTGRWLRTDRCIHITNVFGSPINSASLQSFDSDGFTLNWSNVAANYEIFALSLKGGQYKILTDTQKTSTGTKATTGAGFAPVGIFGFSAGTTDELFNDNSRVSAFAATGPTERFGVWMGDGDNLSTTAADSTLSRSSALIFKTEGAPTRNAEADISSLDSDGFTLDWATADATARKFATLCMGNAAAGGGGGTYPTELFRRRHVRETILRM